MSENKKINRIISNAIESTSTPSFWSVDEKNKVIFRDTQFVEFLEAHGFAKVYIGGAVEFVKIRECIVSKVIPSNIKDEVLWLLEEQEIKDYLIRNARIWSLSYLDVLKTVSLKMHRDTETSSFHYFKNGVVEVTKEGIKPPVPYVDFKRLIWSNHILDRDFSPIDINTLEEEPTVFFDFLSKQCNNDQIRLNRLLSIIGYCLHDYKTSATSKAVILNDELVNDKPEGGSGKGLLVKALSKIRETLFENGKSFDPSDKFAYQSVDETKRILSIDDIKRGFDFESLFSVITEGITVERKNKDKYYLEVGSCPMIIITTNNIIKGMSGSFARRQLNVDIHQYFNANRTPQDEYGHTFFAQWTTKEWSKFDNLMLQCVSVYLKNGILEAPEHDSQRKNAIRATNYTFVEWLEDAKADFANSEGITTQSAKEQYLCSSGQRSLKLSDKKFLSWVQAYCKHYDIEFTKLDNARPRRWKLEK